MSDVTTRSRGGDDHIADGARLAVERLGRHGFDITANIDEVSDLCRSLIGSRTANSPPRAVELMAENVALAIIVRQQYEEPALSESDVDQYLDVATEFFNSLWHDSP
jgi:hypothetical protein